MGMRIIISAIALLSSMVNSVDARDTVSVHTGIDTFEVDVFRQRQEAGRPALIILGGSKGLGAPAYDEIGASFMAAGFNVYLPHLLSPEDLAAIASAKDAGSRIAYYRDQRQHLLAKLRTLAAMLQSQGYKGKTALLGISLGAETAAIAVSEGLSVNAAVLVSGVPSASSDFSQSTTPLHLLWGSDDAVYSLSKAKKFMQLAKQAGGTATLTVYEGAPHDFFLRPGTEQARKAYADAIRFLMSQLKK